MDPVRRPPLPVPAKPPPGPFRRPWWKSPLRGPWLTSFLGSALLPLVAICFLTGLLSHAAYDPGLGSNEVIGPGGLDVVIVDWPTSPAWLYALNQGLHVATGIAAIPLLLAKLWSVIPKLYEWPPVRSIAHGLERLSLALLVGGSLFVFFTGVLNIQVYYPWKFNFVSAHWYGAWIFVAALALHVALKVPTIRRAFRDRGVLRPLRDDLAHTRPEPFEDGTTAPLAPAEPTISRRGLIASLGAACAALLLLAGGQSIGGPLRRLSFLGPRGDDLGSGPNSFQVNKTAAAAAIDVAQTSPAWRLRVAGPGGVTQLSREDLLRMPQATERLPIACVEGWSTTQEWTGVRLAELAAIAGADGDPVLVESLQRSGAFRQATLDAEAVRDERSLLALKVNGADLSLDHGFPARVIVPALPGVHCTKWVASMQFGVA